MSKALCCLSFETLHDKLFNKTSSISLDEFESVLPSGEKLPLKAPLFVTLEKRGNLRGCIGTFQSLPLESGVRRFTYSSAFQDPRFSPVDKKELEDLEVSITLLNKFESVKLWDDWEVGKHGLKISIGQDGDFLGTFLPNVAPEQGWDAETTLWYLLRKADYTGILRSKTTKFYQKGMEEGWIDLQRYEGLKVELSYKDFLRYKQSIDRD